MKLLVIIPDPLTALIEKGEITPHYYNPGNLFEEVHILMCNDDKPDPAQLQKTVGTARLFLHNLPELPHYFIQNTRWFKEWILEPWAKPFFWYANRKQFRLLNQWAQPAVELARQIKPDLIRCHGNDSNAYVASRIKYHLNIPYVVSLHTNPDVDERRRVLRKDASWQERLFGKFFDEVEREGIRKATLTLPVYKDIVPYLERAGVKNYEVAYNVLNPEFLRKKESYVLHKPIRLISVGRHYDAKNPENIIRAVQDLPEVQFTVVGDGPYQERLQSLARECGVENRILFHRAIPNDELCQLLPDQDIFVVHCDAFGVSKAILEAFLTGLPTITNIRNGEPITELQGDFVVLAENTKDGYYRAIHKLITDHELRERMGRSAYQHSHLHWAPDSTEAKYVEIYKKILETS